jgi:glycosyltransferase involved in cell wall biosynthesis
MTFSIITPSFRHSEWLKLCVASVADQGVALEHLVQDSCSDDGTQDWLPQDRRVRAFIEKDKGMYDAVNRGLRRASGEILAYINCDEQYLPGALAAVRDYFERYPGIQVVFADAVVVDAHGSYLCNRSALLPRKAHCWVADNLAILTCATFFRRSLIERRKLFFNAAFRDLGDVDWVMRLIDQRVPMGLLKQLTSVFTETGANMNLMANAQREKAAHVASAPAWMRYCSRWIVAQHRLRRFFAGHYWPKPFSYSLYTRTSPEVRIAVQVPKPTFRWVR